MLNLDGLISNRTRAGKSGPQKPPQKGAKRFFYLAYTHFAKLVGLNMLFLLFCIPVVTIPAALSGMNRVCILLVREGTTGVWGDFIKEFRDSFIKSLPLGILCAFIFMDAGLCVYLSLAAGTLGMMIVLMAAALILFIIAILISSYIFVLTALLSLKNSEILRDAAAMILLEPKTNGILLLTVGGGLSAGLLLLPLSIPVIALFGISLFSLAACTILNEPIQSLSLSG